MHYYLNGREMPAPPFTPVLGTVRPCVFMSSCGSSTEVRLLTHKRDSDGTGAGCGCGGGGGGGEGDAACTMEVEAPLPAGRKPMSACRGPPSPIRSQARVAQSQCNSRVATCEEGEGEGKEKDAEEEEEEEDELGSAVRSAPPVRTGLRHTHPTGPTHLRYV